MKRMIFLFFFLLTITFTKKKFLVPMFGSNISFCLNVWVFFLWYQSIRLTRPQLSNSSSPLSLILPELRGVLKQAKEKNDFFFSRTPCCLWLGISEMKAFILQYFQNSLKKKKVLPSLGNYTEFRWKLTQFPVYLPARYHDVATRKQLSLKLSKSRSKHNNLSLRVKTIAVSRLFVW